MSKAVQIYGLYVRICDIAPYAISRAFFVVESGFIFWNFIL